MADRVPKSIVLGGAILTCFDAAAREDPDLPVATE